MAVTTNPYPDSQTAMAVGPTGLTGPTGPTGTGYRRRKYFAEPPQLLPVHPGDLITAQYVNDLVLAVQNLQARVEDLEQIYDSSYRESLALLR